MRKKRVFISFAMEDKYAREYLVGHSRNIHSSFEFINMSVKEPWLNSWKTKCRTRIKGCDGVIALLSKSTRQADGARWEMKCAVEEGIPIIGMHIQNDNKGAIPTELQGRKVINWTWDGISKFIESL